MLLREAARRCAKGDGVVDISLETEAATDARLRSVMQQIHLKVLPCPYAFRDFSLAAFPASAVAGALAFVRDDSTWSQLVESDETDAEVFTVFRIHFPAGVDNSGFVGWLATLLKKQFGTGVFVTCGHNSSQGGIYDYWGVPISLGSQVVDAVRKLSSSPSI